MKKLLCSLCCIFLLCSCQTTSNKDELQQATQVAQAYTGYAYYRDSLSGEALDLYDLLYYHISQHDTAFKVSAKNEEVFLSTLDKVTKDHPELFWYDRSDVSYTEYQHNNGNVYEVAVKEYFDLETTKKIEQEIKEATAPIIQQIASQPTDYDKVKMAYDYIIDQTDYQEQSEDNQNIVSVFINKVSVCAGYAKSLQYLLNAAGIPCTYMTGGTNYSSDNHAWNMVNIDGELYYIDTTNGDYSSEDIDQRIRYAYFTMDTQEMLTLFRPDDQYELTEAKQANYFYRNGLYLTNADMRSVETMISQSIQDQSNAIVFQCSNKQVCSTISQSLERNDGIFRLLDRAGYYAKEYRSVEIPETNVWVYEYE